MNPVRICNCGQIYAKSTDDLLDADLVEECENCTKETDVKIINE